MPKNTYLRFFVYLNFHSKFAELNLNVKITDFRLFQNLNFHAKIILTEHCKTRIYGVHFVRLCDLCSKQFPSNLDLIPKLMRYAAHANQLAVN